MLLPDEPSHHLLRVLRLRPGEAFQAADGQGWQGVLTVEGEQRGQVSARVTSRWPLPPPTPRCVLLGAPKGPALEDALVMGTEAGATVFQLVQARFTPPGAPRLDRLQRVVASAVAQCGRADTPEIRESAPLRAALERLGPPRAGELRVTARPGAPTIAPTAGPLWVAVGPEGGWAPEEEELLEAAGFVAASLGPFILRTPTAVVASLARFSAV